MRSKLILISALMALFFVVGCKSENGESKGGEEKPPETEVKEDAAEEAPKPEPVVTPEPDVVEEPAPKPFNKDQLEKVVDNTLLEHKAEVDKNAPKRLRDLKPLTERHEAKVRAVWFSGEPGTDSATGGTSEVTIRVEPNSSGEPAVGVMEEFADGTGKQWRASGWLAAFNASQVLGMGITDHEFLVKVGGHIDGPSAGMLMTATMMAMMTGVELLPNTTMTGTINPDGTAGPVGGIPQKMEGAKKDGITRFGYPIGSRNSIDLKTQQVVDLQEVGRKLELEVVEIRDVWDAYAFMTGKQIERPDPIGEGEMELDADLRSQINAKVVAWKGRIEGEIPRLQQKVNELNQAGGGDPALRAQLDGLLVMADETFQEAANFEQSGLLSAAYTSYVQTAFIIRLITYEADFLKAATAMNLDEMTLQLTSLKAVGSRVEALGLEAKVQARKKTIGGRVNAINALTSYAQAMTYLQLAEESLSAAQQILDGVNQGTLDGSDPQIIAAFLQSMMVPIVYYAGADAMVDVAGEMMSLDNEQGVPVEGELSDAKLLAIGYGSAASAGITYFDALITDMLAQQAGVTAEQAQAAMSQAEFNYPIIRLASLIAGHAEKIFEDDPEAASPFQLAFGVYAYIGAATLVNKYYSLQATMKEDGTIELGNRRALTYQLDSARRRALESAALCKEEIGFVPAAAKRHYQLAVALREGEDEDKLTALESFWYATFWCELAVQMAEDSTEDEAPKPNPLAR